jgi:hypothetical protein
MALDIQKWMNKSCRGFKLPLTICRSSQFATTIETFGMTWLYSKALRTYTYYRYWKITLRFINFKEIHALKLTELVNKTLIYYET